LRSRDNGFGGFAKAQGVALGIALGLAAIVSGVLYLAADHPPKLDGKPLALEFELKIPPSLKLPAQPGVQTLHASLYANNRDNRYALLDYDKIASRDGFFFVPGKASLLSQTFNRDLLVSIESEGGASQFIKLKLRAKPREEDEAWSDWITATGARRSYSVPEKSKSPEKNNKKKRIKSKRRTEDEIKEENKRVRKKKREREREEGKEEIKRE